MDVTAKTGLFTSVALRKESVDRNARCRFWVLSNAESLSARRAWIEISGGKIKDFVYLVALRKESVDRNSLLCRILFRR